MNLERSLRHFNKVNIQAIDTQHWPLWNFLPSQMQMGCFSEKNEFSLIFFPFMMSFYTIQIKK